VDSRDAPGDQAGLRTERVQSSVPVAPSWGWIPESQFTVRPEALRSVAWKGVRMLTPSARATRSPWPRLAER